MSRFFKLAAVAALFITGMVACSSSPVAPSITLDGSSGLQQQTTTVPDDVEVPKHGGAGPAEVALVAGDTGSSDPEIHAVDLPHSSADNR